MNAQALPHNLEAEQGVLGAALFDNSVIDKLGALRAEHFYDPVHQRIWAWIAACVAAGRVADPVTLRADAVRDHGLQEIGGAGYILTLLENAARLSVYAADYAALIRTHWAQRAVIALAAEMGAAAAAGEDASAIVHGAETALHRLDLGSAAAVSLRAAASAAVTSLDQKDRALVTGILTFDRRTGGLHPGDLVLIAARPSMGKTAIAANIARAVAQRGRRVHFASLEMSAEQLAGRALSAQSFEAERFPYTLLRQGAPGLDRAMLQRLAQRLSDTMLIDDAGGQTLAHLDASIRNTRKVLGGVDLIVVDYLQLMRATTREGRVQQVTELSIGLKDLAKRWRAPLIALSQLSRGPEHRDDKRPTLSDLRDSGSLEQDADIVIGVYREAYYVERSEPKRESFPHDVDYELAWNQWRDRLERCARIVELIMLKQRHGPIGSDLLDFWPEYDVAVDQEEAPRAHR